MHQFPEGDRGGNSIRLVGGENLHSRWDGLLGRRDLLRDVDREVGEMSDRMKYGNEWDSARRETDVRKWVAESHELCKSVVYSAAILKAVRNTPPGADLVPIRLTDSYMRDAGNLARRRIIAAGLRLASLLDQTSTTGQSSQVPRYPSHWWTMVPEEGVPDWEILPQAAGPGEVILSKRNELGLLSNFAATPFTFHGKRYASLEGFWQMMKYPEGDDDPRATFPGITWPHTREDVAQLTAFDAKRAGDLGSKNMKQMGIDWVTFEGKRMTYRPEEPGEHYRLIVEATWEKVRQNPKVKQVLLSTGDLVLKPDHRQEPNAPAAWRYFDILTEIRSQLQRTRIDSHTVPSARTSAWMVLRLASRSLCHVWDNATKDADPNMWTDDRERDILMVNQVLLIAQSAGNSAAIVTLRDLKRQMQSGSARVLSAKEKLSKLIKSGGINTSKSAKQVTNALERTSTVREQLLADLGNLASAPESGRERDIETGKTRVHQSHKAFADAVKRLDRTLKTGQHEGCSWRSRTRRRQTLKALIREIYEELLRQLEMARQRTEDPWL